MLEVGEILVAGRGAFVGFEVLKADEIDWLAAQIGDYTPGKTRLEAHPRDRGEDLNANRRQAQAHYFVVLAEELRGELRGIEAEFAQGVHHLLGIGSVVAIQISRSAVARG